MRPFVLPLSPLSGRRPDGGRGDANLEGPARRAPGVGPPAMTESSRCTALGRAEVSASQAAYIEPEVEFADCQPASGARPGSASAAMISQANHPPSGASRPQHRGRKAAPAARASLRHALSDSLAPRRSAAIRNSAGRAERVSMQARLGAIRVGPFWVERLAAFLPRPCGRRRFAPTSPQLPQGVATSRRLVPVQTPI
jgi:hypothetical protein